MPGVRAHASRAAGNVFAAVCSLMLAVATLLLGVAPASALADETAGAEARTGSITMEYRNGDAPITGAKAGLYHVADWSAHSGGNTFTPVDPFGADDGYDVDWSLLNGGDSSQYRVFAQTLAGLIAKHQPSATASALTDADGSARFADLPKGLYLVLIGSYRDDAIVCGPSYALVALPSRTADGEDLTMDVTLEPKNDCETTPAETVNRKVVKVWKGDSASNRPNGIVVQLLKDGTVIDEARLDPSNGWSHEWTGLEDGHDYQTVEKTVPEGYTVLTDRENDVVTITNTHTPPDTIGKTGSNAAVALVCAGAFGGLGVTLLVRRRHRIR